MNDCLEYKKSKMIELQWWSTYANVAIVYHQVDREWKFERDKRGAPIKDKHKNILELW